MSVVLQTLPLGTPWVTADPFLFCVHHDDRYPAGNEKLGPAASLAGRNIGMDFDGKDGWRMYHGDVVPGFPQHPHRGFETVTIVRRGLIDHADSLGAAARYGRGDVQWLTAGSGIVHSEMFPLLDDRGPNHLELFQIWLNLPAKDKLVAPYFTMLWDRDIPRATFGDGGPRTDVTIVAGALDVSCPRRPACGGSVDVKRPPAPPPHSWASRADSDVAIWCVRMDAGAKWTLPPAASRASVRVLYFFAGPELRVGDHVAKKHAGLVVKATEPVTLEAGAGEVDILVLQGRPIGEPVVTHGPFVMNTRAEIQRAFLDYERTRFGGWPWPSDAPVHDRAEGRFARRPDSGIERGE